MGVRPEERGVPTVVPPMSPEAINQLVVHLLRNPQVISFALSGVRAEHFREPELQLLWQCVVEQNPIYGVGQVPFTAMYLAAVEKVDAAVAAGLLAGQAQIDRLLGTPGLVAEGYYQRVGLIHHAYHAATADDALHPQLGLELLRRFLQERSVSDAAHRKFALAGQMVPGDLDAFVFEMMGRLTAIKNIGGRIRYDLSAEDVDVVPIETRSTGVVFYDDLMDGGHAAGEIIALFGPQKGGKTMSLVQLCCGVAGRSHAAAAAGEDPGHAYYFTYEETPTELQNRFFSCGAEILRSRLNYEIRSAADFSTSAALLPYEVEMYGKRPAGAARLGERERLQEFKQTRGRYIHVFDMTRRSNASIGGGGIPEIASILNQEIAEGRRPAVVAIDYLNVAVTNLLAAKNLDPREQRQRSLAFVTDAASFIASPFRCPVWIANQYDAPAQKKGAGTRMSAADGSEIKTLGAPANFVFCIGNRDPETNVALLTVDRARRTPSQGKTVQLHFDGDFSRWVDVSGQFDVNAATDSITAKAQAAVAAGLSAEAKAKFAGPAQPAFDPFAAEKACPEAAAGDLEDLI